jgi:polar amino acid transport system substrate-binding protein
MLRYYGSVVLVVLVILLSGPALAETLTADFRHRPPEMVVDPTTRQLSGPLKDVIEQAAEKLGMDVKWRVVPFIRSLYNLKNHKTDIVPRVIRTKEREAFIRYVGPIATQSHDIMFVTRSDGPVIETYADLSSVRIGVKRGTVYFHRFDKDNSLHKVVVLDDFNLARMLRAGHIDAIIVLDMPSLLAELKTIHFTDFKQADYVYPNEIGNYYGMPKSSPIADQLNQVLKEMVRDGTVEAIYHRYGISASAE